MVSRDLAVDLAEGWRLVHETGAILDRHVVGLDDETGVHALGQDHVGEGPFIVHPAQGRTRYEGARRRSLAEDGFDQGLSHNGAVDHGVGNFGIDRNGHVGQQRPRCRRPHRQVRRAAQSTVGGGVGDGQFDVRALVNLVRVHAGLAEFVARQRRATARTVRHYLEVLVEQTAVEELLELPPYRLDVGRVKGVVRVLDIGPVTNAFGEPFEFADVREHRFTTESRELADAHLLDDGPLARDAELLFHLHLDRQSVGVPARATSDETALHGLVATEEILVDASPHVVQSGHAVGGGRTLVEHPRFGALAVFHRAREDVVRLPASQLGFFDGHKINVSADGAKHGLLQ